MDLPGFLMSSSSEPDVETCIAACHAVPGCTGATWALNDDYDNACFLRYQVGSPTPADHIIISAALICSSSPLIDPDFNIDSYSPSSTVWASSGYDDGAAVYNDHGSYEYAYIADDPQLTFHQSVTTCPGVSYEFSIQYSLTCRDPNDCKASDTFGLSVSDAVSTTTIAANSFAIDPWCNCIDELGNQAASWDQASTWNTFSLGYFTASSSLTTVEWSLSAPGSFDGDDDIEVAIVDVRNAIFQMV